mmetsp:Transcript_23279/g.42079  ORF Transcript_23279/g.42079 Transcript_23279/m.42079 type:complete len:518 (+) Transcript_23279:54-1607(+)
MQRLPAWALLLGACFVLGRPSSDAQSLELVVSVHPLRRTSEAEEGDEVHSSVVSVAVAAALFISLMLALCVFYLVNHKAKDVRDTTWELLANTLSIFVAVFWYQTLDSLFDLVFEEAAEESKWARFFSGFAVMLTLYTCLQVAGFFLTGENSAVYLKLLCTLGAHMCGFSFKECFLSLQFGLLSDSVFLSCIAVVVSIILTLVLMNAAAVIRGKLSRRLSEEGRDRYEENMIDAENDMGCLAISFLSVMVIMYAITGEPCSGELGMAEHPQSLTWAMFGSGVVFGCSTFIAVKIHLALGQNSALSKRIIAISLVFCGMSMAWSLLFFGWWEIVDSNLVSGKNTLVELMILAVASSFFCGAVLVVASMAMARWAPGSAAIETSMTAVVKGLGLQMAFTWEQCFDVAVEDIADQFEDGMEMAFKSIASLAISIFVLPAFVLYIIPRIMKQEEKLGAEFEEAEDAAAEKVTERELEAAEKAAVEQASPPEEEVSRERAEPIDSISQQRNSEPGQPIAVKI